MSELTFIDSLKRHLAQHPPNAKLLIPPGDDTALVPSSGPYLFAADMLMDRVHFDLRKTAAKLAGRKALAVNLSDIAAMGGTPSAVTVSLALPKKGGDALGAEVMFGIEELARAFDTAVAGGDTNAWDGPLVIAVSITGTPHPRGPLTRAGARVGDKILVTGGLGGSLASGRHLTFVPRVREAKTLHERYALNSMLDLSDGLGGDLRHVLAASGVGAKLVRAAIPVNDDVRADKDPLARALGDGEDFELCFTASPDVAAQIVRDAPLAPLGVAIVGEITAQADQLVWDDGTAVTTRGYVHETRP